MSQTNKFVFNQILDLLPRYKFNKIVSKYTKQKPRKFTYWQQLSTMIFAQITRRDSLRDLALSLNSHPEKLYPLGFCSGIKKSTIADANTKRDWRIYRDFALVLIKQCKDYNINNSKLIHDLESVFTAIYAYDSSRIVLNLYRYNWANYKKTKSGIKLHTLLDLTTKLPEFIHISEGRVADVKGLAELPIRKNAMYVFDRGYFSLSELFRIEQANSFFVIRAKGNLSFQRYKSNYVDRDLGIICDQIGKMKSSNSRRKYPKLLRRVKFKDEDTTYIYLTNNFDISTQEVVLLYKDRWEIELFFKWIKQHLKIKSFWGYSENAVHTQIWISISCYLLLYIVKNEQKISLELNEIAQILSLSLLERKAIAEVFTEYSKHFKHTKTESHQLSLL